MNLDNQTILFAKTREEAIIPTKRVEDAGYDIYACFNDEFIVIKPNETKLISTGIATAFSNEWVAIIKERGSTGTKGMGQRCGVIDSGFRSEWFVPITNHNDLPLIISKNEDVNNIVSNMAIVYPYSKAIAQFIMLPVPKLDTKEITYEELLTYESKRGMGALGSSKK